MKIYNGYILITALVLLLTTIILIATGQASLNVYYTACIIEALIITELFVYFNAKARRRLTLISAVLFGGFLFVASLEVIKILA
ncbi:unnamed protein product [marine sediment metagenome]|uniref:Uncharacterized protein n=1 Tax=marine sediment metagenome TaxID=412755 RepID=X1QAI0_9ZZZZ